MIWKGPSMDFPGKVFFANLDINNKVYLFNETIKNTL